MANMTSHGVSGEILSLVTEKLDESLIATERAINAIEVSQMIPLRRI